MAHEIMMDALASQQQGLALHGRVKLKSGLEGTIRHLGPVHWAPGDYVGCELFAPHARGHDGCIDNVTYFAAKPRHGIFVRPSDIAAFVPGAPEPGGGGGG